MDKVAKGRSAFKLSKEKVKEIIAMRRQGESQASIARKMKVSAPTIFSIVHRKKWRHVKLDDGIVSK